MGFPLDYLMGLLMLYSEFANYLSYRSFIDSNKLIEQFLWNVRSMHLINSIKNTRKSNTGSKPEALPSRPANGHSKI